MEEEKQELTRVAKKAEYRFEEETRIRIDFEHKINSLSNENRHFERKTKLLIGKIKEQEATNEEKNKRIMSNNEMIRELNKFKTEAEQEINGLEVALDKKTSDHATLKRKYDRQTKQEEVDNIQKNNMEKELNDLKSQVLRFQN